MAPECKERRHMFIMAGVGLGRGSHMWAGPCLICLSLVSTEGGGCCLHKQRPEFMLEILHTFEMMCKGKKCWVFSLKKKDVGMEVLYTEDSAFRSSAAPL